MDRTNHLLMGQFRSYLAPSTQAHKLAHHPRKPPRMSLETHSCPLWISCSPSASRNSDAQDALLVTNRYTTKDPDRHAAHPSLPTSTPSGLTQPSLLVSVDCADTAC
jgi:hypothetical protein